MQKINFIQKELFEWKFKRKPKEWTIEQVHSLYLLAKKRSSVRRKDVTDHINKIVSEVPLEDTPKYVNMSRHIVYFYHRNDDTNSIHMYSFQLCNHYGYPPSYSYGQDRVKFTNRDEKLEFLLNSDEKRFELGQKFHELTRMESSLHWRVFGILSHMVEKKLEEIYKGKYPPRTLIIEISGIKYFIETENERGRGGFKLCGEYNGEVNILS
jgi:hypothetical protein